MRSPSTSPSQIIPRRRGVGLTVLPRDIHRTEPLNLVVDSTGLKIYGEGEWLDAKHGSRSGRRWRKLHIGIDAATHDVVVAELTPDDVGDVSAITELLKQIDSSVASLTADGAYDDDAVYGAVAERHPAAVVIIPPRVTAATHEAATSQRDRHIAMIAQHGRISWERRTLVVPSENSGGSAPPSDAPSERGGRRRAATPSHV